MRIISKFKDYYDGVAKGMQDSDLTYVRHHEVVAGGEYCYFPFFITELFRHQGELKNHYVQVVEVQFCGLRYPYIALFERGDDSHLHDTNGYPRGSKLIAVARDVDEVIAMMAAHPDVFADVPEKADLERKIRDYVYSTWHHLDAFFKMRGKPTALNISRNTPVTALVSQPYDDATQWRRNVNRNADVHVNPRLADLGFTRVVDPQTAYQEISMWMGTHHHRPDREMVPITDEVRAQQHGFDKRSFRKDPTKRTKK